MISLSGRVIDKENKEGLIQANVLLINLEIGTSTDFDGNYLLEFDANKINKESITLTYSYMGYANVRQELLVSDLKAIPDYKLIDIELFQDQGLVFAIVNPPWHKKVIKKIKSWFRR